ncbi:MAG TPA: PAS domain S-box protein [Flavobacteriales bacterium]
MSERMEGTPTAGDRNAPEGLDDLRRNYEQLFHRNLAGVFRATVAGRFIECNASMARILGYADPDELLGLDLRDLYVNREDRERFLLDLTERGQLVNYEILLKHRSGRTIHVLENVFFQQHNGKASTIEGTLIDVTAIKQAELEQRALINNYRQLMDRVRDAILIVQDLEVRYANPAAEQLFAQAPLTGASLRELMPDEGSRSVLEAIARIERTDRVGPVGVAIQPRQGQATEVVLFAEHIHHQGRAAAQITIQDMGGQPTLVQERLRSRMAEEVNEVLRMEILEHRRTQEELHRSKQFARNLVDSSLDAIIAVDQQGAITEFNPAAGVKFGYEAEEVLGRHSAMLYENRAEFDRVQNELNRHGAFAGEVSNRNREGGLFTCFLAASRLFDESGRLLGSMGVSRDISQSKRDLEIIRVSEERYRDLFENATDLIHSVDAQGRILYVNTAWKKALGYTEEDLKERTILDIVHPDQREAYARLLRNVLEQHDHVVVQAIYLTKDGRELHVEGNSNARLQGGVAVATRTILRDVTQMNRVAEEVQEHQARQRALYESGEHMFWTVDRRIALTSFNLGYANMIERLHGKRPELNRDPQRERRKFAPEEYHTFWEERYAEAFAGRPVRFETDLMDQAGQRVCNEIFLSPIFEPDGSVEEIYGIGHEVTEQREAEDKVREQAARLNSIFGGTANMMVWTLDREFRITSFNLHFHRSCEKHLGVHFKLGDDMKGVLQNAITGKERSAVLGHIAEALSGEPQQFEARLNDREGRPIWLEAFLNPILLDGQVTEISCLAHGITDKKLAQSALLESLNEKEVLLKEVHHRVKNNLQIISSIFNLKSSTVGDDPKMLELLRDSQDRIRSMAFIHESLYLNKNLGRVDLADYIDSLSRNLMMSYSLSGRVSLEKDLEPVELELDQAIPCGLILNELISNALKHAFPAGQGGTIHIGLRLVDGIVSIRVSDDGKGLPEGFDEERDANLGLQLVHTLIGQLDGRITRERTPGAAYLITFGRSDRYRNK